MDEATTIENARLLELETQRNSEQTRKNLETPAKSKSRVAKAKASLSFSKKLAKHWLILGAALFFDLLALIPFISVIFNLIFGGILFLYFGHKKMGKNAVVILGGSMVDFIFSILPVNTAATVIRIAVKETS
ncbi:MAG: hypothetical protein COT67_01915 [Candidatus Tagabacteria bacterium CG09_land_8_20_14_0_10_41_14]|uniref:Uncharacterized protein n=2 Tax=Candidatus Tagaibacteriota TaxID=1817918 RepID=A0A2H0WLE9_9BACT|nr:MAG: hypothetical protein COT67_01915 [Candidatus Tagabacteria bacterium CG09_land_8_20_14_0_10_41_14]PJE73106.1 MAG: hypothetical protein COV00_01635 [Candidatus Tagabacteria bacterium CG10_big_fil_rev_8_21_14_0_10_40_13]